jgi:hypothetical protein
MLSSATRRGFLSVSQGGRRGTPITTNLVAWFRKGRGITAVGGAVSAWADQSGNGRHYTQASGGAQPALQAGGTILFDGTSDFMATAGFTLVQPFTRYFRIKQVTWTSGDYFCDGGALNTGVVFQTGVSPSLSLFAGGPAAANAALAVGAWGSAAAVFNGASSVLQIDATTATGNPSTGNPGGLTLGASFGGLGQWSNIEVAEEIVYSVAHDATQRAAVIAYLNTL